MILATNIAEAGVTIAGVVAVVDTGTEVRPTCNYHDRINDIETAFISKERARQRAGRAGRTMAGTRVATCLYTQNDYTGQCADRTSPRLLGVNLERHLLYVLAIGQDPRRYDYITKPDAEALDIAMQTLVDLGFVDGRTNAITREGTLASKLPIANAHEPMRHRGGEPQAQAQLFGGAADHRGAAQHERPRQASQGAAAPRVADRGTTRASCTCTRTGAPAYALDRCVPLIPNPLA